MYDYKHACSILTIIYRQYFRTTRQKKIIKDINRLTYNFLWNKTDRIKRNALFVDILGGGIGLIDLES